MTERSRSAVSRDSDRFAVGPSAMRWTGDCLIIDLDEVATPFPRRVKGRIKLFPEMIGRASFDLDPGGRHSWRPIAPRARVEVELDKPGLSWRGSAYWDSNQGTEPLEAGFVDWQWSRAHLGRDVAVIYEGVRKDRSRFASALRFDRHGDAEEAELPPPASLMPSKWLMKRSTRSDTGSARVMRTWEDAPFYARSTLETVLFGERVHAVHESLSLTRFASPIVQGMLPYRMPRRLG